MNVSILMASERRDLNSRPLHPKCSVLPTELRPDINPICLLPNNRVGCKLTTSCIICRLFHEPLSSLGIMECRSLVHFYGSWPFPKGNELTFLVQIERLELSCLAATDFESAASAYSAISAYKTNPCQSANDHPTLRWITVGWITQPLRFHASNNHGLTDTSLPHTSENSVHIGTPATTA